MSFLKKNILIIIYFLLTIVQSYYEIYSNVTLTIVFVSLAIVMLILFYIQKTTKINYWYLFALVMLIVANVFHPQKGIHDQIFSSSFFFVYNLILSYILFVKNGMHNPKQVYLLIIPITIAFLIMFYFSLTNVELVNYLALIFSLQISFLFALTYRYYNKHLKKTSFLLMLGVALLIFCYAFGIVNILFIPNSYFAFLDSLAFFFSIYFITVAIVDEDKEYREQ